MVKWNEPISTVFQFSLCIIILPIYWPHGKALLIHC